MAVTGIAFVDCSAASGGLGRQVFPTEDGALEFWREGGSEPRNWRATPKCGEARFSEVEFANTYFAHGDGPVGGRITVEEIAGSPMIYTPRDVGTSSRVWRFDPVAGTIAAVTASLANAVAFDVTVRGAHPYGCLLSYNGSTGRYKVHRWTRSSEGASAALSDYWTFAASGQAPENIDVEDADDGWIWVSGGDGSSNPFVMRLDDDETTWAIPEPTGYSYSYIDTIQCVGVGEAIGVATNTSSLGYDDGLSIFRFTVGDANATEITEGCTVDGQPYRDWAEAEGDNIAVQSGVKVAVLGEYVAAMTSSGRILLGTLIRSAATGRWRVGRVGWAA